MPVRTGIVDQRIGQVKRVKNNRFWLCGMKMTMMYGDIEAFTEQVDTLLYEHGNRGAYLGPRGVI